jgi:NADH-quinone oxidoreductase subunit J
MLVQVLFIFFALLAILSAAMTISRQSPVASALWLINTFFSLAAIYTLLGAYFIGVVQILVYAGAIMVLFLFVIMLLNLGNDYRPDLRGSAWKIVGGLAGLMMLALIAQVALGPTLPLGAEAAPTAMTAQIEQYGAVGAIGVPMFTEYMVHLQVAGLLLLVAVVGAVMLAKRNV